MKCAAGFLILLLARARADFNDCKSADPHVQYAEYCYQQLPFLTTQKTYDDAVQVCRDAGGHLAVLVSDKLLEKVANIMTETYSFVALKQVVTGGQTKRNEGWLWVVDGLLHLTVGTDTNLIKWGVYKDSMRTWQQPDDGKRDEEVLGDFDSNGEDYGALSKAMGIFDVPFDAERTSKLVLCQFRKPKALFELYAEKKKVVIDEKSTSAPLEGIASSDVCAIRCYIDPSCLAIGYNKASKECQFFFDRLQDYGQHQTIDDPDSSVWVKSEKDYIPN